MIDWASGTAGEVEAILTVENRVSSNERTPASCLPRASVSVIWMSARMFGATVTSGEKREKPMVVMLSNWLGIPLNPSVSGSRSNSTSLKRMSEVSTSLFRGTAPVEFLLIASAA